ncbi:hypothetical protein [Paracoccus sp. IB05]|uniref:hypothetical protein n=1 Tax=Paracoccus sp. IB05 TaxID=2779367 RepID=UPI0018E77504|nr:hypothetical protein [Paracoccus sp. IB05]MBJ2153999.1 hypothetical protein [Paracoccus sp. IB05]
MPQRTNAAWESSDAFGRRAASLSLPACPYADQVQRPTLSWLEDERRFLKHVIKLPPASAHVELIDTVVWTSAHNGYDGKSFTVHEILEDPFTGIRQLSIREVDPNDWVVPPDDLLPTPPAPQPATPVPSRPEGFEVLPLVIRDGAAAPRRFGIRIKWAPELEGSGMRWQARLAGGTDIALHGTTQNVKAGQVDILAGPLPAVDYELQITLIADRITAPSGWLAVTTPDVRIGTDDLAADVVEIMEDAILAGILADASRQAAQTAGSVITTGIHVSTAISTGGLTTLTMILGRQAGGPVTQVGGGTKGAVTAALRFSVQAIHAVAGANLQTYEILVGVLTQADQAARSASGPQDLPAPPRPRPPPLRRARPPPRAPRLPRPPRLPPKPRAARPIPMRPMPRPLPAMPWALPMPQRPARGRPPHRPPIRARAQLPQPPAQRWRA